MSKDRIDDMMRRLEDPVLAGELASKATKHARMRTDLLSWMAVHGNLCLALRHPANDGLSRDLVRQFRDRLGRMLVEAGMLTREQLLEATALEREMSPHDEG
jgi:hypothetical protein